MATTPLIYYPNWYSTAPGGVYAETVPDDKVDPNYCPMIMHAAIYDSVCGHCGTALVDGCAYVVPLYTSKGYSPYSAFCTERCCRVWSGIEPPPSKPYNTIKPCVTLGSPGRTSGQVPVSTAAQRSTEGGMNTST